MRFSADQSRGIVLIYSLLRWLQVEFKGFLLYSRAHHMTRSRCSINVYGGLEERHGTEDNISTEQFIWTKSLWNSHLSPKTY